ncbi:unnamed protein product, partial [Sphacelaria rigidula]
MTDTSVPWLISTVDYTQKAAHIKSGQLENGGLDDGDPIQDSLVIKDGVSNFVWLEPAESSMEAKKVEHFLTWFKAKAMESPEVWVGDTG